MKKLFGANLKHYRKARGLTQPQLAEKIAMSPQTITKLERGTTTPSFDTIEKLVDVLDVPPVAFFSVGMPAVPTGERGKLVEKIHITLARMNEDNLSRAHKMVQALVD